MLHVVLLVVVVIVIVVVIDGWLSGGIGSGIRACGFGSAEGELAVNATFLGAKSLCTP
jgi:hypothetical protein